MSNKIREMPNEKTFLRAIEIVNGFGHFHWGKEEALKVICREIKRLSQEKASFSELSLPEIIEAFSDAPLPSSNAQVVIMNDLVARLHTPDDFKKVHDENGDPAMFSVEWAREHQRIFLSAWLSACREIERGVHDVWYCVAKQRCSRYAQFLIVKRVAEILAESEAKNAT